MRNFYRPFLEREWKNLAKEISGKFLLGLSIPFPGCLTGALVCAESAKKIFGGRVIVVAGGGYVNTELRFLEEEKLFDYFDYLSFDRGYGSLEAVLKKETDPSKMTGPLYKTMYRGKNGIIIKDESINNDGNTVDDNAVLSVFPDYTGIDFSRYIRPVDDINPMFRLWSDGRWLKAYLAHGCYWNNCIFCDKSLDYIRCYKPVDTDVLFRHLLSQAASTGVRGVHLVDEACPPARLLRFAMLNREAGLPLVFWGNIRFEKSFTPDAAAILAAGGLIGVSAGIEIATEEGLNRLGKGIDLQGTVDVCAAFKEAGVLVHAYLIYGYWDQDEQEITDSAETVRQFFAQGLLDSAFWHQFVLTKHSRLYTEKKQGLHPKLKPGGDPFYDAADGKKRGKIFALNDLSFAGEKRFDRFSAPLSRLLGKWMLGETFECYYPSLPAPSVPPDLVTNLLDSYARRRDRERKAPPTGQLQRIVFLATKPLVTNAGLKWRWRFNDCSLKLKPDQTRQIVSLLETASGGYGMNAAEFYGKLETVFGGDLKCRETKRVWEKLRRQGLAVLHGYH